VTAHTHTSWAEQSRAERGGAEQSRAEQAAGGLSFALVQQRRAAGSGPAGSATERRDGCSLTRSALLAALLVALHFLARHDWRFVDEGLVGAGCGEETEGGDAAAAVKV